MPTDQQQQPAPRESTPPRGIGDYRFSHEGEIIRVVIAGDVIALPNQEWSYPGFAQSISEEWLLHSGNCRLPGSAARRRLLARFIVAAMQAHHQRRAAA